MYTLGVLVFLSVTGLALLALSATTARTTAGLSESTNQVRAVDGALETAINSVRYDQDMCVSDPGAAEPFDSPYFDEDIAVTCVEPDEDAFPPGRRLELTAEFASSGGLVGKARVQFVDRVECEDPDGDPDQCLPIMGYSVEVCDWLLGRHAATEALDPSGCSS